MASAGLAGMVSSYFAKAEELDYHSESAMTMSIDLHDHHAVQNIWACIFPTKKKKKKKGKKGRLL